MYLEIQPPFSLNFSEMERKELKRYFSWFLNEIPSRVSMLEKLVRTSKGYEDWCADFSRESLLLLGNYLTDSVEGVLPIGRDSGVIRLEGGTVYLGPVRELTTRSYSIAIDSAMYFGSVFVKNAEGALWVQDFKNKRYVDYGQPVISGFGAVYLNPVRIIITLSYALLEKEQGGGRLAELYDVWSKLRK